MSSENEKIWRKLPQEAIAKIYFTPLPFPDPEFMGWMRRERTNWIREFQNWEYTGHIPEWAAKIKNK